MTRLDETKSDFLKFGWPWPTTFVRNRTELARGIPRSFLPFSLYVVERHFNGLQPLRTLQSPVTMPYRLRIASHDRRVAQRSGFIGYNSLTVTTTPWQISSNMFLWCRNTDSSRMEEIETVGAALLEIRRWRGEMMGVKG